MKKRRLRGENCFEVQIRQNHFIPEGSWFQQKSFGLIANMRCFSDVVDPERQDGYYERVRTEPDI